MTDRVPAIMVRLLPKDTTTRGTTFVGVIPTPVDVESALEGVR